MFEKGQLEHRIGFSGIDSQRKNQAFSYRIRLSKHPLKARCPSPRHFWIKNILISILSSNTWYGIIGTGFHSG
jgi:hypothetical protein